MLLESGRQEEGRVSKVYKIWGGMVGCGTNFFDSFEIYKWLKAVMVRRIHVL